MESLPIFSGIGLVGAVVYFLFGLACLWRTFEAWMVLHDFSHLKLIFHASMSMFAISEMIYSLTICLYNNYTLWGYAFHILGIALFVISYTSVIYLWGKTIGRRHSFAKRAGIVVVAINLLTTFLGICFLCASADFHEFQFHYVTMNLILIVVFALSMLFLTCGMLWYGVRLQQKLNNGVITNPVERSKKIAIIIRINGVLLVCNICFFLRVLALAGLAMRIVSETDYTAAVGTIGWFVLSMWVPTLIPGCTLLVIMRVKEVARKKWGQASDNPVTNSAGAGSSYIPPNIRASHSSSATQLSDSELDGLDNLLITEYEHSEDEESFTLDAFSPVPNKF